MSKPPQLIQLRCTASGQDFNSYSVEWSPDKRNITPCPACRKEVKLMAKYRACSTAPARNFVVIPYHNKRTA